MSNRQAIAGTFIEIGVNLSGLRAGVAQTKDIAAATERGTKISLPVLADTSQLKAGKAEVQRVAADISKNVKATVSFGLDPNSEKQVNREIGRLIGDLRRQAQAVSVPLTIDQKVQRITAMGGSDKQVAYAQDLAQQIAVADAEKARKAAEAAAQEAAERQKAEAVKRQGEARDLFVQNEMAKTKAGNAAKQAQNAADDKAFDQWRAEEKRRQDEARDLLVRHEMDKTKAVVDAKRANADKVNAANSRVADEAIARAKQLREEDEANGRIARSGYDAPTGRGGGGDGEHGGELNPFSFKGLGKLAGAAIIGEAFDHALRAGAGLAEGSRALTETGANPNETLANQLRGRAGVVGAVENLPILGAIVEFGDKLTGATAHLQEYANAVVEARQATIAAAQGRLVAQAGYAAATGSPQEAVIAATEAKAAGIDDQINEIEGKLRAYEKQQGYAYHHEADPVYKAMAKPLDDLYRQRDLVQSTGKAEADRAADVYEARLEGYGKSAGAAGLGAQAATLRLAEGGTSADVVSRRRAAADAEAEAQRLAIRNQTNQQAAAATTPYEKQQVAATGKAMLDALDATTNAAAAKVERDEARAGGDLVAGSRSQVVQSRLRAAGDNNNAALEATRDQYRQSIQDAGLRFGTDSDQVKALTAERDQKLNEQRVLQARQASQQIVAVQGEANAAVLRANRDFLAADRAMFDASVQGRLIALKGQPRAVVEATKAAIDAERSALNTQQANQRADVTGGFTARRDAANAQAQGYGQLAGLITRAAAMQQELRDVSPEFRAQAVDAQRAELTALKTSIIAPNQYATEMGVGEATGGPTGHAGEETKSILELIARLLASLDQKTPSPATHA